MNIANESQSTRHLDVVGVTFKLLQSLAVVFESTRVIPLQCSHQTDAPQGASEWSFDLFRNAETTQITFERRSIITANAVYVPNSFQRYGQAQFVRERFLNVDASLVIAKSIVVIAHVVGRVCRSIQCGHD